MDLIFKKQWQKELGFESGIFWYFPNSISFQFQLSNNLSIKGSQKGSIQRDVEGGIFFLYGEKAVLSCSKNFELFFWKVVPYESWNFCVWKVIGLLRISVLLKRFEHGPSLLPVLARVSLALSETGNLLRDNNEVPVFAPCSPVFACVRPAISNID